eukprot:3488350-Pleurochrysis_carterae.AAC.1
MICAKTALDRRDAPQEQSPPMRAAASLLVAIEKNAVPQGCPEPAVRPATQLAAKHEAAEQSGEPDDVQAKLDVLFAVRSAMLSEPAHVSADGDCMRTGPQMPSQGMCGAMSDEPAIYACLYPLLPAIACFAALWQIRMKWMINEEESDSSSLI